MAGKEFIMARFTAKIFPWENNLGWQEHDFVDRTGKDIEEMFFDLNKLQFTLEDLEITKRDYSIEVYENSRKLTEFWLSEYLKDGVLIGDTKYTVA